MTDPFKEIADKTHFNIYHSSLWNNTGRRFAEAVVTECAEIIDSQDVDPAFRNRMSWAIKTRFGLNND